MEDQAVSFLKEFVTNPQSIGAIAPSSQTLAKELVTGIDWSRVQSAVEYGPGLGAITEEILKLSPPDFFAIEINEVYADLFSKRYPAVAIYQDSVKNVVEIVRRRGLRWVDCVISGLPWANFSDDVQDEFLDATMSILNPDNAWFTSYAYVHGLVLKSGKRFREKLEARFSHVERSPIIWRNTPPAIVYHCLR